MEKWYNMSELGAMLSKELDRHIGRNTLFKILREAGYLNKHNEPYSQYRDYFETQKVERAYGYSTKMTLVKPKGMDLIRQLIE